MDGETLKEGFTERLRSSNEKMAITFLREGLFETELSYGELDQDTNRIGPHFNM